MKNWEFYEEELKKYGFCVDCRWRLDSEQCHKCDCYVNAVRIIQDVMKRAYKECEQE